MVMELIKDNFIIQRIGCTIAQFMYGHISVTVLARMYMYMRFFYGYVGSLQFIRLTLQYISCEIQYRSTKSASWSRQIVNSGWLLLLVVSSMILQYKQYKCMQPILIAQVFMCSTSEKWYQSKDTCIQSEIELGDFEMWKNGWIWKGNPCWIHMIDGDV